jgi:putative heme iron utilization protein
MNHNIRKLSLVGSLAVGAFFAMNAARAQDNFEQGKTMTLKMLDERIEDLKRTRSCVIRSETREALKECRAEAKESRREMHKEMRDARDAMKRKKQEAKRE